MSSSWRPVGIAAAAFSVVALALPYVGGFPLAYVLILATFGFTLWAVFTRRRNEFAPDAASVMFISAFVLLAIAFALSARGAKDLAGIANFAFLPFVWPLSVALRREAAPNNALLVVSAAAAGTALAFLVAVTQTYLFGVRRATGFFSDPIWSVDAALPIAFIAIAGLFLTRGWWRVVFVASPLLILAVVLLSGSRGPLIAYAGLTLVAIILVAPRVRTVLVLAGAAIALVVASLALWPRAVGRLRSIARLVGEVTSGAAPGERSAFIRAELLTGGWQAFLESPIFGHGWGRFGQVIAQHVTFLSRPSRAGWFHLHNDLANFAVAAGILGVIAYFLLIAAPVVGAVRSPRDSLFRVRVFGAAILCTSYLLCGLTNSLFGFEFLTAIYVCLTAILLAYCRDPVLAKSPGEPDQGKAAAT